MRGTSRDEFTMDADEFHDMAAGGNGAARRVYLGIMRDLELRRMVPGQRLIETDLAQHYGVGRNAVREAIQRLSGRGIIDLSPNRSPAIRTLDVAETNEILDVASVMTGLVASTAAGMFVRRRDSSILETAVGHLEELVPTSDLSAFGRARRGFYRALLAIAANRELQRLFPAIGMHIIYAQYQSHDLLLKRIADYKGIAEAVAAKDSQSAERQARLHVEHVREFIDQTGPFPL